jgi:membrane-bound lytic murein transglycosylase C
MPYSFPRKQDALAKGHNLSLASVKKVNKMSSKELYNTLLRDLKYEETRNYLKKVWERKEKYKA